MTRSTTALLGTLFVLSACFGAKSPPDDNLVPAESNAESKVESNQARHSEIASPVPVIEQDGPPKVIAPRPKAHASASAKPTLRPEQDKGQVLAIIGDATRGGFWLQTSLVSTEVPGRIVVLSNGAGLNLTLIPAPETDSGARISPAAFKTLGLSGPDPIQLKVFIR